MEEKERVSVQEGQTVYIIDQDGLWEMELQKVDSAPQAGNPLPAVTLVGRRIFIEDIGVDV